MNALIEELKENNQDFEFYPTTKEMIKCIHNVLKLDNISSVLDIGCGTCNFKKWISELDTEEKDRQEKSYNAAYKEYERNKYSGRMGDYYHAKTVGISQYYVIEKSQILISKLDKDVIVLGTDFNSTLLIDKKADVYFCNPPYSEYENWTVKIIEDGNCTKAYLVIPQRWKENEQIKQTLENTGAKAKVLGSFDFLNAERQARAKVDIVEIDKRRYSERYGYYNDRLEDFNEKAFDRWFDDTFKMRNSSKDNKYEYEIEKEKTEKIKNQLVGSNSKGAMLVEFYNNEQNIFFEHFKAITKLDIDVLETIGVKKEAVKEALKQKVKSLKTKYWKIVFDEFEEITDRLTSDTRGDMFNRFQELQTVDFTLENIYPLILWVIKNANGYYNNQLIDFFKKLSSDENVKPYKSNQKTFTEEKWRFKNDSTHYTLDYRIIMSSPFRTNWNGRLEEDCHYGNKTINDIFTIAKNLGFEPQKYPKSPSVFGEKYKIYYQCSENVFMEYRVYKNGNMHVKFDKEFIKAMNVEVSRLLGWIRTKEDIKKEFTPEMAQGAEKYFKSNNFISLENSNIKLLGTTKTEPQEPTKPSFEVIENQGEIIMYANYEAGLKEVINTINMAVNNEEETEEIFNKCIDILKDKQNGFVYRDTLIVCDCDTIKMTFKENKLLNKVKKLLKEAA